jgi:cell division transport system permease protein
MRAGVLNFWRNGVVSLSTILVMVVALSMIGSTLLLSAFLNSALTELRDKVDVNVYLVPGASEENILSLKATLEALPEVAYVEYVSEDKVLSDFKDRHENDELTLSALDEIGNNPFGGVLNIKAKDPAQYESVERFLENDSALSTQGASIIDRTNYSKNKVAIDRLSGLIAGIQKIGIVIICTLALISILITFNTVRLAIYTARDEIAVMRLVGARNFYTRGPFLVEGILYGLAAACIATGLFYPVTLWLKQGTSDIYSGIDLFQYYVANFNEIFGVLLGVGILLGLISSYLAVRKYLKI